MLSSVIAIAKEAGNIILSYRTPSNAHALHISRKNDNSVVTAADLAAHRVIITALNQCFPDIPCVSEESVSEESAYSHPVENHTYWLIDPLDGTRGFIAGSPEFTVNIALVDHGHPVLGVIYAPALDQCYYAARGQGAFSQYRGESPIALATRPLNWQDYRVVLGRYTLKSDWCPHHDTPEKNSYVILQCHSSLKIAWTAAGIADLYPRRGETHAWDTAAGHCILEEAGGAVVDFEGQPLEYNHTRALLNPSFVAIGDRSQIPAMISYIRSTSL